MDLFKTNDMAMVAFLKYEGHLPIRIGFGEGEDADNCFWTFERVLRPNLDEAVRAFGDRTARVEPMRYSSLYGETKGELYNRRRERNRRGGAKH